MASSKHRNSNLVLSCLNFTLFILSLLSLPPIIVLKTPPSVYGLAFVSVSSLSLLTSFLGFFSLTRSCFLSHISLLFASSIGQLLAFLSLFLKEKQSITLFRSPRDPREAKLLVRLECVVFLLMYVLQVCGFFMTWAVHSCWVREYEGLEAEREAIEKKRGLRLSRVYEESMTNSEKLKEIKDREFDEKMKKKYGQWVKTDLEGWRGFGFWFALFCVLWVTKVFGSI